MILQHYYAARELKQNFNYANTFKKKNVTKLYVQKLERFLYFENY